MDGSVCTVAAHFGMMDFKCMHATLGLNHITNKQLSGLSSLVLGVSIVIKKLLCDDSICLGP